MDTRREFLDVGKTAIARVLSESEADNRLTSDRPGEGWYHYLFDTMFMRSPDEVLKNRLSVVTFNCDRSFERVLVVPRAATRTTLPAVCKAENDGLRREEMGWDETTGESCLNPAYRHPHAPILSHLGQHPKERSPRTLE